MMKLKKEFVTVADGEGSITVSVDTGLFPGMIRSNETSAFILKELQKDTTVEQIVERLYETYDADKEVIKKDVEGIIERLRAVGALDE